MPQRSMLDGLPPDPQFWVAASSVRGLRVLGCGDREITAPIPPEWAHLLLDILPRLKSGDSYGAHPGIEPD